MQWKWLFISVCIFESFSFTGEWAAKFKPFTHNMGHYMPQGAKQLPPNCYPTVSNNTGKKHSSSSSSKWTVWLVSPPWQMKHLLWSRRHQHIPKFLSTQFLNSNWSSSNHASPKMDSELSHCLTAFSVSRMPDLWSWEDNLLNCSQSFEMQSKDRYIFDLSLLTSHSDYLIIHYSLALPQCQVLICFILYSSYLSFSLQSYYSDIFKWK